MATEALPILGQSRAKAHDFDATLLQHGLGTLTRVETTTLQINVGKLCNQACHHCHVEAGPKRTEIMPTHVADRCIGLLANSPSITTIDLTGGAPELNANFSHLVINARSFGLDVIDRCNLTVFFQPGQQHLARFLAENRVQITASLPCYTSGNVEKQRGKGVFEKSIRALHILNQLGYGRDGSGLTLNLVYNPLGAYLPPPEAKLEADYKRELAEKFGIEFNRLFTITNMPIKRFAEYLARNGEHEQYMSLLVNHFNSTTVGNLMCRSLVSVGWDGRLYDCDFNQMLDVEMPRVRTIWDLHSFTGLAGKRIATGAHCFGCTAGGGSSCGGSLA